MLQLVMKICTDPMCPECGRKEETAYHFVGNVMPWWWLISLYLVLISWRLMNSNKFNHILFWGLPEPQRDLLNLSVISGPCIGSKLTMASVMDGIAVLPDNCYDSSPTHETYRQITQNKAETLHCKLKKLMAHVHETHQECYLLETACHSCCRDWLWKSTCRHSANLYRTLSADYTMPTAVSLCYQHTEKNFTTIQQRGKKKGCISGL